MKKIAAVLILGTILISCNVQVKEKQEEKVIGEDTANAMMQMKDERLSLDLNPMQKQHQLKNMRSHLEAIHDIIGLLSSGKYDEASEIAYTQLGSTTEMQMMCKSFGNEEFENLGLAFHQSADTMSEIFKSRNMEKSLTALSNTINYCVQCHTAFKQ
jgi:hypothetical protein